MKLQSSIQQLKVLFVILFLTSFSSFGQSLIVNEFSNGSGSDEYVELLVVGTCGGTMDIRGYIFDDNNGDFDQGGAVGGVGIAGGFLRFRYVSNWAAVPVGSLIIIYNDATKNTAIPSDDPSDSNNDKVYILPGNNVLLEGTSVKPSATNSQYTPFPFFGGASWSTTSMNNTNDAAQVRYPDGTYCHGFSYGVMTGTNSAGISNSGGPDALNFTSSSGNNAIYFNNGNYRQKANFIATSSTGNESPGTGNSTSNQIYINDLRTCSTTTCTSLISTTISGQNQFCSSSFGIFSIQTVLGATNYIWTAPSGSTLTTSGNGLTANIQFGTVSGNIQVMAYNSCSTVSSTKFVQIQLPILFTGTISGPSIYCTNENATFSIASIVGATSYFWESELGGIELGGQGTSVYTTQMLNGGLISVTPKSSVCPDGPKQTFTVSDESMLDNTVTIIGNNFVCANTTGIYSTLSVVGAKTYTWSSDAPDVRFTTLTGNNLSVQVLFGSTSGNIFVYPSNTCSSLTGSFLPFSINNTQNVVTSISGKNTVCKNTVGLFSAITIPGVIDYQWSSNGGAQILSGNGSPTVTILSGLFDFNVSVKPTITSCGTSVPVDFPVQIIQPPLQVNSISGLSFICSNNTTSSFVYSISTVSGASNYSWGYSGLLIISSSGDNLKQTIQLLNSTASLTVSSFNKCYTVVGASLSISVKGNISPAGSISGLNSVCPNLSPVYSIEPVSGASSYQWSASDGVSILLGQSTNTITLTSLNQGTILRVTPISTTCGNGQESPDFPINIKPSLTVGPSVLGTSTICGNINGIIYKLTTVAGATSYFWNIEGLSVVSTSGDSLTKTVNIGSKNATLTGFAINECGTVAGAIFIVNVKDKIAVPAIELGPFTICGNSLGTFTFPGTSSYPITWNESFLPTATIVGGQGTGIVSIKVGNYVGDGNISASTSDECGGTYGWAYRIIVSSVLGNNLLTNWPDTLCQNDIKIFSNTLVGASFHWSFPNDFKILTSSLDSSYVTIQFGSNSGIVTTTSYNSCGNGPSKTQNVIVLPYPNSNAGGESNGGNIKVYPTVLDNNSVTLNGARSSQNALATDLPKYSYTWFLNPPSITIDNANSITASFKPKELQTKVYFNVSNGYCSSLDSALINLDMDQIPNAFTPNEDDANNTWRIDNLYLYKNFKLTIFNKWGSPVKEFTSYESDPNKMWDGKSEGVDLPSAVYYYVLDFNGENGKKARKGTVTIVR